MEQAEKGHAADHRDSGQRDEETGSQPGFAEPVKQRNDKAAAQAEQKNVQRMKKALYHFDSVNASIESVFLARVKTDRVGQHDGRDRKADDDRRNDQSRRDRVDCALAGFGLAQRRIDDRRCAARDIARCDHHDMQSRIDQREADDNAHEVAVGQHAPDADQRQAEAGDQKDGGNR